MQLFNNFGRFHSISTEKLTASASLHLKQPQYFHYAALRVRVARAFRTESPLPEADEFAVRATAIIQRLRSNPKLANVLNGCHLPLLLPQLPARYYGNWKDRLLGRANDYGTLLKDRFLPAVERAYQAKLPNWRLDNPMEEQLSRQISVVAESRHGRLIEQMLAGSVVALYFPVALESLSVDACRQLIKDLPEEFLLSGGVDTAMALATHPDLLGIDRRTPELLMAGVQWNPIPTQILGVSNWSDALSLTNFVTAHREGGAYSAGLLVIEDSDC